MCKGRWSVRFRGGALGAQRKKSEIVTSQGAFFGRNCHQWPVHVLLAPRAQHPQGTPPAQLARRVPATHPVPPAAGRSSSRPRLRGSAPAPGTPHAPLQPPARSALVSERLAPLIEVRRHLTSYDHERLGHENRSRRGLPRAQALCIRSRARARACVHLGTGHVLHYAAIATLIVAKLLPNVAWWSRDPLNAARGRGPRAGGNLQVRPAVVSNAKRAGDGWRLIASPPRLRRRQPPRPHRHPRPRRWSSSCRRAPCPRRRHPRPHRRPRSGC